MSTYFACLLAIFVVAGLLCGALLVPWLSDIVLRRAYNRSLEWWNSSFQDFVAYRQAHPERLPKPTDKGADGAIGVWLDDALRLARRGELARERAQLLCDAGLDVDPLIAVRTEQQQADRCSFRADVPKRVALGVICAAAFALLPASGRLLYLDALMAVCFVAMLVGVVCDVRARMIPIECCVVLGTVGALYQVLHGGLTALGWGLAAATVVLIACWFACNVLKSGSNAIGRGDIRCMFALALATGSCALTGAFACYVSAAVVSGVAVLTRKLSFDDGLPMAPFLALWLVFGGMVVL